MNIIKTKIPGLIIIEPKVFGDERGFFLETYNAKRYAEVGIKESFVQDNLSFSRKGILRGLHYQKPMTQGKLVQVLQGEVYDVAVDIRVGSPTFGQWEAVLLSENNKRQFYVPEGFAHGFMVTSDVALFSYKCTSLYNPDGEFSVAWDDPELSIPWPSMAPQLSDKDRHGKNLSEIPVKDLPEYE
ncbi:dTDP-4-dehydrorhamnose 3,5-epimerase [Oceanicoccus sp. KOV_DT_Chl]|uniref:dTDP-4-dehydrorhamnose 3,5-epimerase n=1 Tax=Oceanicoccus sp. KOV_DT_Chl TaxID=1904639 RepID=UPI000C7AB3E6|nr:dTDP-4-dehydrorhamnose 3,5-epimerase [Oceanicoccus sp. KOV_DT_Chl]